MQDQILPLRLGVNVDHVATIRQARGTNYPSPLTAALISQAAGADSITVHLREDRRHIQEHDVTDLRSSLSIPLNLEVSVAEDMVALACGYRPQACCLVPERREELTTEGGLDVLQHAERITAAVKTLTQVGTQVALFVEPDLSLLDAIKATGAQAVEIHTGRYADAVNSAERAQLLEAIGTFAMQAHSMGLKVHAGHGLTVENTGPIARIAEIQELNIGHALIADAILMGLAASVARMKNLMVQTRLSSAMSAAPAAARSAQSYSAI